MLKNLHFLLLAILIASCTTDGTTDVATPQAPTIVAANPGNGRVEFVWSPNDSEATYTQILADGELISTEYVPSDSDEITRTVSIDGGQSYSFTLQNIAEDGSLLEKSSSMTVEIYDDSWGDTLEPCEIMSISFDDELGGTITWEDPDDDSYLVGNTVFYVDWEGNNYSKYVDVGDGTSYFEGANLNTEFTYISHYRPVYNAIDSFVSSQSDIKEFEVEENSQGQRVLKVKSIKAMIPYFSRSYVSIELEQGEYWITPEDVTAGYYETYGWANASEATHDIFQPAGDYSTYDFGNSTIYVDTDIFDMKGLELDIIHTIGNWNVVKNMKMIDYGPMEDAPSAGYNNVTMDGTYNILQNIQVHSTGSYPYGYGYLFGKGSTYTIAHDKHCGVLMRGVFNLFTDGLIDHKAYGHCYYTQGGWWAMVRNTYVHGDIGSTDWVLADKRSRYSADAKYNRDRAYDVGYLTDFGYVVQPYGNIALTEEGIRAYSSGRTFINGESLYPSTGGAVAIGCTVNMARNSVHFTESSGYTIANAFENIDGYEAPPWWTGGTGSNGEDYSDCIHVKNASGTNYIERVTCINGQHGGGIAVAAKSFIKDCRVNTTYGAMAGTGDYANIVGCFTLLPFELDTKVQGYQVVGRGTSGLTVGATNILALLRDDTDLMNTGWGYERKGTEGGGTVEEEKRRITLSGNSTTVFTTLPYDVYFSSGVSSCTVYAVKTVLGEDNCVFNGSETEIAATGSSSGGTTQTVGNNTVVWFDSDASLTSYLNANASSFINSTTGKSLSDALPDGLSYTAAYTASDIYPRVYEY